MSKLNSVSSHFRSGRLFSLACLLALALALSLSACGSSKSEDSSGGEAPQAPAAVADQAAPAEKSAAGSVQTTSTAVQNSTSVEAAASPQPSASPEAGAGGGVGPIADPETGTNRKVIYKANVTMKVPRYETAEEKLRDAIHLSGSYILQFNNSMDAGGKGAVYVIKVPADGFSSFIDRLRDIEKDLQLQMEGSDVTEEYVDLSARLQAKKTVESRLLSFMDKATKTDDLVRFSNELAAVQEQIEQLKGRMRYLDQNVAYSTVNVRLYEGSPEVKTEEEKAAGFGDRLANAVKGSARVLGQFGEALMVFAAALLPVAAVAAVIGIPVYFVIRNQQRTRREAAALKRREWNGREAAQTPADDGENPET